MDRMPICPNCGFEFDNNNMCCVEDSEEQTVNCPKCHEDFLLKMITTWESEIIED